MGGVAAEADVLAKQSAIENVDIVNSGEKDSDLTIQGAAIRDMVTMLGRSGTETGQMRDSLNREALVLNLNEALSQYGNLGFGVRNPDFLRLMPGISTKMSNNAREGMSFEESLNNLQGGKVAKEALRADPMYRAIYDLMLATSPGSKRTPNEMIKAVDSFERAAKNSQDFNYDERSGVISLVKPPEPYKKDSVDSARSHLAAGGARTGPIKTSLREYIPFEQMMEQLDYNLALFTDPQYDDPRFEQELFQQSIQMEINKETYRELKALYDLSKDEAGSDEDRARQTLNLRAAIQSLQLAPYKNNQPVGMPAEDNHWDEFSKKNGARTGDGSHFSAFDVIDRMTFEGRYDLSAQMTLKQALVPLMRGAGVTYGDIEDAVKSFGFKINRRELKEGRFVIGLDTEDGGRYSNESLEKGISYFGVSPQGGKNGGAPGN